jgi:hypothetical protein
MPRQRLQLNVTSDPHFTATGISITAKLRIAFGVVKKTEAQWDVRTTVMGGVSDVRLTGDRNRRYQWPLV